MKRGSSSGATDRRRMNDSLFSSPPGRQVREIGRPNNSHRNAPIAASTTTMNSHNNFGSRRTALRSEVMTSRIAQIQNANRRMANRPPAPNNTSASYR
jgi:hypothetical protein